MILTTVLTGTRSLQRSLRAASKQKKNQQSLSQSITEVFDNSLVSITPAIMISGIRSLVFLAFLHPVWSVSAPDIAGYGHPKRATLQYRNFTDPFPGTDGGICYHLSDQK
jgi:hypothetical protein